MGMALSVAVIFGRPYGVNVGILAGAISCAFIALAALAYSPVITVTPTTLQVGRARMPITYAGTSYAVAAKDRTRIKNDSSASAAYIQSSPGVKSGVIVAITDLDDPHPYWLISTRQPEALLRAIESAQSQSAEQNSD